MKTAARKSLISLIVLAGVLLVTPNAKAQAPGAVAPAPEPIAVTAPSAPASGAAKDGAAVKEVLDSIKIEEKGPKSKKTEEVEEFDEEEEAVGTNVPESVKGVIKKLNKATKDVTIEDINAAREAVVKLDVLIDIEKRLNDLSTLRAEREEQEGLANAIPAAALGKGSGGFSSPTLSPAGGGAQPAVAAPPPMAYFPEQSIEVKKIVGASANYSATIKDFDGSEKRISVGDKLSNGATVDAISRSGVTITTPDKKKKTVQVKDVSAVFGGR